MASFVEAAVDPDVTLSSPLFCMICIISSFLHIKVMLDSYSRCILPMALVKGCLIKRSHHVTLFDSPGSILTMLLLSRLRLLIPQRLLSLRPNLLQIALTNTLSLGLARS